MDDFEEKVRRILALLKEGPRKPWQPWMDDFLRDLDRLGGNVTKASELSPVSRYTAYNHKKKNPEFSDRWDAIVKKHKRRARPLAA